MDTRVRWLLETGRFADGTAALLSGLGKLLCAEGLDVTRMSIQPLMLHPEIEMVVYLWRRREARSELRADAPVVEMASASVDFGLAQEIAMGFGGTDTDAFRSSPIYLIFTGAPWVRARIDPAATDVPFPIIRDLRAAGATDYVAWPLRMSDGAVCSFSLTTQKPGGFTDADLDGLRALLDPLAMCVEIHVQRRVARALLHTYLGRGPGEAVLAGRVRRGDVERMEAAIWFSDLRGFTQASTSVEPAALVAWLNEYFCALAGPIAAHGGEILKFIGDAVLAVFPVTPERSTATACRAALSAAGEADGALDALNLDRRGRGLPPLAHGIGLHVGEVQYGNIGADRRLDFTVIGQAVNLASRIESLCGKLGRSMLASEELARLAEAPLSPIGTFELKGIPGQQVVYARAEAASEGAASDRGG